MGSAAYLLNALVSALCAVQLLLAFRRSRYHLLLWSGLCFAGLTITHVVVFIDLEMLPEVDLYLWRLMVTAVSLGFMLYGLVWREQ